MWPRIDVKEPAGPHQDKPKARSWESGALYYWCQISVVIATRQDAGADFVSYSKLAYDINALDLLLIDPGRPIITGTEYGLRLTFSAELVIRRHKPL